MSTIHQENGWYLNTVFLHATVKGLLNLVRALDERWYSQKQLSGPVEQKEKSIPVYSSSDFGSLLEVS